MRLLVFQHIVCEHPGIFREFLASDGVRWDAVELDEGEPIPPLEGFDGLWVFGGPMDVWQEAEHPWLVPEKATIREAVVERRMPFLGLCLGHQLLAEALGGSVGPAGEPEIGVLEVALTEAGRRSPFLAGLSEPIPCLQWHSAEVTTLPEGAEVLASSPACRVNALSWGERAFSIQYHVEVGAETVPAWGAVPAYAEALERALGPGALESFQRSALAHMEGFNRDARRLYDNWMAVAKA